EEVSADGERAVLAAAVERDEVAARVLTVVLGDRVVGRVEGAHVRRVPVEDVLEVVEAAGLSDRGAGADRDRAAVHGDAVLERDLVVLSLVRVPGARGVVEDEVELGGLRGRRERAELRAPLPVLARTVERGLDGALVDLAG